MSADNWAQCPRCKAKRERTAASAEADVADAYGKVDIEEFDRMRDVASRLRVEVDQSDNTFREDYEIYGANEGEIVVSYRGGCKCGLAVSFEHRHPFTWTAKP